LEVTRNELHKESGNDTMASTPEPSLARLSIPPSISIAASDPKVFQLEDSDDEISSPEPQKSGLDTLQESSMQASQEIPLNTPSVAESTQTAELNRRSKPQPPIPPNDDTESAPDLFLPGLVSPNLFLPIPNTDPLTPLLTKYVPPEIRPARDTSGNWRQEDFHTLVMTNSWRAIARMARDRIVSANPQNLAVILDLWYLRLSSLARLRLFNQTSAECTHLFSILASVQPRSSRTYLYERLLPFELEVMRARTKYWAGDALGYLDELTFLLKSCKRRARSARSEGEREMWKERAVRIALIIASQLIEMKDHAGAAKLLEPLCSQGSRPSAAILSCIGRIQLESGHVASATEYFRLAEEDPTCDQSTKEMNDALLSSANGNWTSAIQALRSVLEKEPDNAIAINDLAVALLNTGQLQEGIDLLEATMKSSPSAVLVVEPFLFNLATLYELRSTTAFEKKRQLLIEVAKWSGDGLRATCLKLPAV